MAMDEKEKRFLLGRSENEKLFGLERLAIASREELLLIPKVGTKITDSIIEFFNCRDNLVIIRRLREAGLKALN